jgi:hypothetical protein
VVNQARLNQGIRQAITTELSGLPDAQLVSVNIDTRNSTLQLLVTIRTSRQPDYDQVVALQSAVAVRLQRTITLQLIVVPTTRLDPLVPPTPTGTPTPSRTPMPSPSVTFTVTNTYTPTSTLTPTPTFTPTPILAFIANTGGRGVYLRDAPGGRIIGSLSEGAPVDLLYQRVTVNGSDWIEVQFEIGRTGWVQAFYLIIKP